MGYVKTYNEDKGFGFCEVHGLENGGRYTDVFFHISDIGGYSAVYAKQHVLFGEVNKTSKGWKMTEIRANHDPDAWGRRRGKVEEMSNDEEEFESSQPKRLPASLRNEELEGEDKRIRGFGKSTDDEEEDEDREGGYWKGDKYIPK